MSESINQVVSFKRKRFSSSETYYWTSLTLQALRSAIQSLGFSEIVPAPFSQRYEPGARHSIVVLGNKELPEIKKFPERVPNERIEVKGEQAYYVCVSHVVEKQMAAEFLEKVYCLAPCLRLVMDGEESSGKHLYSFFQFEIEWKTQKLEEVFSIGTTLLKDYAKLLLDSLDKNPEIEVSPIAKRNITSLGRGELPKITFAEALERVGRTADSKGDLTPEEDATLSNQFDTPFWIYNYPPGVRDSIYHEEPKGVFQTYDLMLPFGYGELTTGGIRPTSSEEIVAQSKELGNSYHPDYAQWKERSQIQTAGFGIGVERLLKFISGAESILDFIQYHDYGPNKTLITSLD